MLGIVLRYLNYSMRWYDAVISPLGCSPGLVFWTRDRRFVVVVLSWLVSAFWPSLFSPGPSLVLCLWPSVFSLHGLDYYAALSWRCLSILRFRFLRCVCSCCVSILRCFSRFDWRSLNRLPSKVSSALRNFWRFWLAESPLTAQWSLFGFVDACDWRSLHWLPSEVFRTCWRFWLAESPLTAQRSLFGLIVPLSPCWIACCMFSFTVFAFVFLLGCCFFNLNRISRHFDCCPEGFKTSFLLYCIVRWLPLICMFFIVFAVQVAFLVTTLCAGIASVGAGILVA